MASAPIENFESGVLVKERDLEVWEEHFEQSESYTG